MKKRLALVLVGTALVAAACSGGAGDTTTTTTDSNGGAPATAPAAITIEDQTSDGSPGPVIGHFELLQAGESIDGDGIYTFVPPDKAIDVPGITEDGNVAVIPVQINL